MFMPRREMNHLISVGSLAIFLPKNTSIWGKLLICEACSEVLTDDRSI